MEASAAAQEAPDAGKARHHRVHVLQRRELPPEDQGRQQEGAGGPFLPLQAPPVRPEGHLVGGRQVPQRQGPALYAPLRPLRRPDRGRQGLLGQPAQHGGHPERSRAGETIAAHGPHGHRRGPLLVPEGAGPPHHGLVPDRGQGRLETQARGRRRMPRRPLRPGQ